MDFKTLPTPKDGVATLAADALIVVLAGAQLPSALDPVLAALAQRAIDGGDFVLKPGHALLLHYAAGVKATRVVLVALGDGGAGGGSAAWRKALASGLGAIKNGGARHAAVLAAGVDLDDSHAEALVAAAEGETYLYRLTKPSAGPASKLERVSLLVTGKAPDKPRQTLLDKGLARGRAIAAGVGLARELANRPGNHCTPTHLAREAKALAKSHGLKVEVLERADCAKLGMGAFLAVAQASKEPLKFIVMRWNGGKKGDKPLVLVGKGITFDTGGISIKPAAEMDEMKFDMGGAASVLGTMRAVAELKLAANVIGIVPTCENMPGGAAVKPGDVVTSLSGQTIEILNTDAEGRLILCDALTYAERFDPAVVVDIATLTGACVIALGHHRSGLFSPDDALAAELLAAGERGADPAWRLPLDAEYDEALKSNFADMANVGPRAGGSITAAKFLQRYTAKFAWAHLDIAGTGWKSGKDKGGTGRPVALLTHFLLGRAG